MGVGRVRVTSLLHEKQSREKKNKGTNILPVINHAGIVQPQEEGINLLGAATK